jgi:glycerol uptake facilitator-like aquaporin
MQRYAAEFLGTLLLVATVIGSGVMAEALADGNDAVALLGNTVATAAMLFVLITIFGPVSGAHFNPAVTAVFAARGEIGLRAGAAYGAVQIAGAIAGAMLAHAMFGLDLLQTGVKVRAGFGQLLGEATATFALVLTILGALRHRPDAVATAVALVITAGYWFTSSTSFANPAVTIARALTDSFSGIRPADVLPFIAAQSAGAALAAAAARVFFASPKLDRAKGSRL